MADNFGLKIGLEGEKEFKKALADINQSFKVLGSEMKVVQSQFDKNDDSVEALTARNQVLGKEIDAQKKKIETLRQALENASTSFGENDRRTQQWQIQLNNAQAALNNMERELDQNQRAIDSMGDEMRDAAQQTDKFGDEIDDAANKTDKASGKLEKVGSVLKGLAVTAGAAVAAAGAALAGLTKSLLDLAESTREYREDQAKLDAAFTTAGLHRFLRHPGRRGPQCGSGQPPRQALLHRGRAGAVDGHCRWRVGHLRRQPSHRRFDRSRQ